MSRTPTLAALQQWMQTVLTHPGGIVAGLDAAASGGQLTVRPETLDQVIAPSQSLSSAQRLTIYAQAYSARLIDCLEDQFPVLAHALGKDLFGEFAAGYLVAHPPRSYTLNRLGDRFADYLNTSRPEASAGNSAWSELIVELAGFEWLCSEVFDGPGGEDSPPLRPDDLLAIPVEHWCDVRLTVLPGLRLATFRFPIHEYFQAVRATMRGQKAAAASSAEELPPSIPNPRTTRLAVLRRDFVVRYHELSPGEHELLQQIMAGKNLGEATSAATRELLLERAEVAVQLATIFRRWGAEGFFVAPQPGSSQAPGGASR